MRGQNDSSFHVDIENAGICLKKVGFRGATEKNRDEKAGQEPRPPRPSMVALPKGIQGHAKPHTRNEQGLRHTGPA
jgi:hypothetical protein